MFNILFSFKPCMVNQIVFSLKISVSWKDRIKWKRILVHWIWKMKHSKKPSYFPGSSSPYGFYWPLCKQCVSFSVMENYIHLQRFLKHAMTVMIKRLSLGIYYLDVKKLSTSNLPFQVFEGFIGT